MGCRASKTESVEQAVTSRRSEGPVLLGRTRLGRIKEEWPQRSQLQKKSISSALTQFDDDALQIPRSESGNSTDTDASGESYQARSFSADSLILGVKLACLAYDDRPQRNYRPITDILRGLGYTLDRIFSHPAFFGSQRTVDAHGFIAHSEQDVVLSYRGTTGVIEWMTDLAGSLTPFEEAKAKGCLHGQVHQDFYEAMRASLPDIQKHLMPQLHDNSCPKRLIIVGHGIGGAIAMGALGYLLQNFDFAASPHRVLFVSTGQPRFGDEAFSKWLDTEVMKLRGHDKCDVARVVNDRDTVPCVPSRSAGFCHAAKLFLLSQEGELLDSPEVELHNASLAESVEEHRTDHYLKLLSKAVAR